MVLTEKIGENLFYNLYDKTKEILLRLNMPEDPDWANYSQEVTTLPKNTWGMRQAIYQLAKLLEAESYLEIGVQVGFSLAHFLTARPHAKVYAFDIWEKEYAGKPNPGPDFVLKHLKNIVKNPNVTFINGDSHKTLKEFKSQHPGIKIDLITVDGDHSSEGAWEDLLDVEDMVGKALVFDDITLPNHSLLNVWNKFKKRHPNWKYFESYEGFGAAVGIVPFNGRSNHTKQF